MNSLLEKSTKDIYIHQLINQGVFVFNHLIPADKMQQLIKQILKDRELIFAKINTMNRPLKNYSDIAERELGRVDYRCGFTADIFDQVAQPIIKIIKNVSPTIDFRHYWGVITSLSGAGPTSLHRDVYPILNTTEGDNLDLLDLMLPPYYFTVLIPLIKITQAHGPTEFIKSSHRIQLVEEANEEAYAPLLSPGDIVIFDGRTLHRGLPNNSNEERMLAYITFVANWYHDQTFEINDYLFPELSRKGK